EPGSKLCRGFALQLRQVGSCQVCEHATLQLADRQQHDLLHLDVLKILCGGLERGDDKDQRRNLIQDTSVAVSEHLKCVVDHHRIECCSAGHDPGQRQHEQQS